MRYIADYETGQLLHVSFGADIECDGQGCTEYTGSVPEGYASLEAWYLAEVETLYRWKVVDGELTLDETAVAPEEQPLPISRGGTEAKTAEAARVNLGVAPAIESADYPGCYYRMVDDEVEWLNPPMVIEEEYRTTERYQAKPVYTKLLSCGLPTAAQTTVDLSDVAHLVRHAGTLGTYTLPYNDRTADSTYHGYVVAQAARITLNCDSSWWSNPNYPWVHQIWYTKSSENEGIK